MTHEFIIEFKNGRTIFAVTNANIYTDFNFVEWTFIGSDSEDLVYRHHNEIRAKLKRAWKLSQSKVYKQRSESRRLSLYEGAKGVRRNTSGCAYQKICFKNETGRYDYFDDKYDAEQMLYNLLTQDINDDICIKNDSIYFYRFYDDVND